MTIIKHRMKIKDSINWYLVENDLKTKGRRLHDNADLLDMLRNVGNQVSELSREEVKARSHRSNRAPELLERINSDIEMIEEYLLIAMLAG